MSPAELERAFEAAPVRDVATARRLGIVSHHAHALARTIAFILPESNPARGQALDALYVAFTTTTQALYRR
jgi:hypothetical protein